MSSLPWVAFWLRLTKDSGAGGIAVCLEVLICSITNREVRPKLFFKLWDEQSIKIGERVSAINMYVSLVRGRTRFPVGATRFPDEMQIQLARRADQISSRSYRSHCISRPRITDNMIMFPKISPSRSDDRYIVPKCGWSRIDDRHIFGKYSRYTSTIGKNSLYVRVPTEFLEIFRSKTGYFISSVWYEMTIYRPVGVTYVFNLE